MPRIAYFDCFCGAAGDMILAALVDAGLPVQTLQDAVASLKLPGVRIAAEPVRRHGLAATLVSVHVGEAAPRKHRHLRHIFEIIDACGLPARVTERAKAIFQRLAEAEAAVHGTSVEKVHFHEVGADDALVDIVGTCAGLEALQVERIVCSPIPPGSGTVCCEHGVMPVPAPAAAVLLKGVPLAVCDEPGELTTPTGAAILTTLAESYGPLPELTPVAIGVGAGSREGQTRANILRVFLGDPPARPAGEAASDTVVVLETQLDDTPGQNLAFACEQLLAAGALDVFVVPISMKKGRPGQLVSVLCRPQDADRLEETLFVQTRTFGVRRHAARRTRLIRRHDTVQTRFGPIRVKVGSLRGQIVQAWPEYEDCAAAARAHGADLQTVQDEALRGWAQRRQNAAR